MAKQISPEFIAPVVGIHTLTCPKHKFSPIYEVRDRNMRQTLAITWRPLKHEVPEGGSVWELMYNQKVDKFITFKELNS